MTHGKDKANTQPMSMSNQDVLTNILRQGTQKMPAEAIENEVVEYLDRHACVWDDQGHRLAVRNGYVSHKFFQARRIPVGALGMSGLAIVCFFHLQLADWSRLGNSIGISFLVSCRGYQWCRLLWPEVSGFVVAYIANKLGWSSLFYFFVIIALIAGSL